MTLADLLDSLDLPPTRVAETAWPSAVRRTRRRRAAATSLVAAGAAAAVVAAASLGSSSSLGTLVPTVRTPTTAPSPRTVVTTTLSTVDYDALAARVPRLQPAALTELSDDGTAHAVLAIVPQRAGLGEPAAWTTIQLLGEDGRWRHVDVPGLVPTRDAGGYQGYALVPTSLDSDGSHLAIPQPGRVVVVDVRSGRVRTYQVPGLNKAVVWADSTTLLVTDEETRDERTGRLLDLETGRVVTSDFLGATRFLPDGSWVTWEDDYRTPSFRTVLTSSDRPAVETETSNDVGVQVTSPLANDRVAVGLRYVDGDSSGPVVVDRRTGNLLGFLQGSPGGVDLTTLLGLEGDTVLLSLPSPDGPDQLVVRWDWAAGRLEPVAVLPAALISWAGPSGALG